MKFLVDMPLSPTLAAWLTGRGDDAIHASQCGLHQASDATILLQARNENRVIITADLDYPRLLATAQAAGPGLVLFRGGDFSNDEAIEGLTRAFGAIPEAEFLSSIVVIEKGRIRQRRLPLS